MAALVWTIAWWKFLEAKFPADPSGLFAASGTAAAVLVGFLATANAIVLGLSNTDLFVRLRNAGYVVLIHSYFFEATIASISFLVVAMVGFFLNGASATEGAFPLIWMISGSLALFLFARIARVLFNFLKQA
ncbi:hypothetical protein [Stappia sp.]|uniref:hypothetical protein n=1 Tax=Stappia sp. TaxID=1870903 RepID=UPI003C7A86DC